MQYSRSKVWTLFVAANALWSAATMAQLSPGDLHQAHQDLEGIKNCTKCHNQAKGIAAERCLQCHTALKERVDAGKGLHATPEYKRCEGCHVEHQGRQSQLIWWKNERENFSHNLAGYALEAKHGQLKCEQCHQLSHIQNSQQLATQKVNLQRTYLGLSTQCLSCHKDEHRSQFKGECLSCHSMEGWKPASRFEHARTAYPLTGKHRQVACDKCHAAVVDHHFIDDPDYRRYTGISHTTCTDCHQDIHSGKLGVTCTNCHSTEGWKHVQVGRFNHAQTRYPLLGRHAEVACEKCHLPGKPRTPIASRFCTDCHSDYHQGQFARRTQKGGCEECHTVSGFSPSTFSLANHKNTDYPITGAHLAVPCIQCHTKTFQARGQRIQRFTFNSTGCFDCHGDPHKGDVKDYMKNRDCQSCHQVESWHDLQFDHDRTSFPLVGRHRTTACGSCHKKELAGTPQEKTRFKGLPKECADCHKDVHQGQFTQLEMKSGNTNPKVSCFRCHTPMDWKPNQFDHNRDSRFKLEGVHAKTACKACHKQAERNGQLIAIFKPTPTACEDCHVSKKGPL